MTAGEDGGTRVVFAGVNVVAQVPASLGSDDAWVVRLGADLAGTA